MQTEEEAQERWCPMARVLSHTSAQDGKGRLFEGGYSWNRAPNTFDQYAEDEPPYTPRAANCIGGKCAVWRWGGHNIKFVDGTPEGPRETVRLGYCGLAGRPS